MAIGHWCQVHHWGDRAWAPYCAEADLPSPNSIEIATMVTHNRFTAPNGLVVLEIPLDPREVVPLLPAPSYALRSTSHDGHPFATFESASDLLATYEDAWSKVDRANWDSECFWEFVGIRFDTRPDEVGGLIKRALEQSFLGDVAIQWFAFTLDDPFFRVYFNRASIDEGSILSMVQERGGRLIDQPYGRLGALWTVESVLSMHYH